MVTRTKSKTGDELK